MFSCKILRLLEGRRSVGGLVGGGGGVGGGVEGDEGAGGSTPPPPAGMPAGETESPLAAGEGVAVGKVASQVEHLKLLFHFLVVVRLLQLTSLEVFGLQWHQFWQALHLTQVEFARIERLQTEQTQPCLLFSD